jgi:predicted nucleic acid-binding protein
VITEAAHLLRRTSDGVRALLSRIETGAIFVIEMGAGDVARIDSILAKYHDQRFDFADACLMHLAEREAIEQIFTLDQRHFSRFRTRTGAALELRPQ